LQNFLNAPRTLHRFGRAAGCLTHRRTEAPTLAKTCLAQLLHVKRLWKEGKENKIKKDWRGKRNKKIRKRRIVKQKFWMVLEK